MRKLTVLLLLAGMALPAFAANDVTTAKVSVAQLEQALVILVEYRPADIAGKSYVCPARSVSILLAHTAQQTGAFSQSHYKGSAKTYLNDVVFGQYRRFGSESRILAGDSLEPNMPSGADSSGAPNSPLSRGPTH